jgi:ketosteroid isomerase-like protein
MMNEQENVQIIQRHFAAFGKGNLSAALDTIAEKVDWQSPVTRSVQKEIPWGKPRHSREEVSLFFKELLDKVQLERFEIFQFTAQDDRVIVEGMNSGKVKSTGRTYEHDWIMVFNIHDGKIVRHRHYYNTADILKAF